MTKIDIETRLEVAKHTLRCGLAIWTFCRAAGPGQRDYAYHDIVVYCMHTTRVVLSSIHTSLVCIRARRLVWLLSRIHVAGNHTSY